MSEPGGETKTEFPLEFFAPGYRRYPAPGAAPLDREAQQRLVAGFQAAFPDARVVVEDLIAAEDRVAVRFTLRGTHRGEFRGIPATGKQVVVASLDVLRVENGKFVEHWGGPDVLSLLQQLGARVSAE